ncbi:pyridoxamine 5'-phosphate oxidase family protein [Streptomyces longispororuber]|uniref:pyridoxamine 5'-phosphate oxidase family protein n=1 Tax=Streptomyces longispororuber TaxID=68230 RepID=UPI0036F95DA8
MPSVSERQLAFALLRRTDHGRVATSMRALPFLAAARHIVCDGHLLLRMHRGFGYHDACLGSVVAYGADNLGTAAASEGRWTVQLVGLCEGARPTPAELARFGPPPCFVDGEPYDAVYLRLAPRTSTVHTLCPGTSPPPEVPEARAGAGLSRYLLRPGNARRPERAARADRGPGAEKITRR